MIHYDKKSYEEHRDATLNILKLVQVGLAMFALVVLVMIAMTGCYNAAMMRATGESKQTCQSDSDCPSDFMCVFNITPSSALGECVNQNNYDPWANRQLEDFIKLKERQKKEDKEKWKTIQQDK